MQMTVRDFEVLRTLCRMKAVRTSAFVGTMFGELRWTQRRLRALCDLGLIERHTRVLVMGTGAAQEAYWRLTARGAATVLARFPEEPEVLPRMRRAKRARLTAIEHHDGLVSSYLSLVGAATPVEVRAKASTLVYRADREVRLSYIRLGKRREVVPDATLYRSDLADAPLFFFEYDRSTETHKRVRDAVRGYSRAVEAGAVEDTLGTAAPREPYLVYAAKTERRAEGLRAALAREPLGRLKLAVVTHASAADWLHRGLFGVAADVALPQAVLRAGDPGARATALLHSLCAELEEVWPESPALGRAQEYLAEAS